MDTKGLPDLTPIQEGFFLGILSGMTASDAVRESTDTSNWSNNAIWVRASRLRAHAKVRLWIERAHKAVGERADLTQESHIRELKRIAKLAEGDKQYNPALRAEELVGRVSGHYVERIRNETPDPVRDAQAALLSHVDSLSPAAGKLLREAILGAPAKSA